MCLRSADGASIWLSTRAESLQWRLNAPRAAQARDHGRVRPSSSERFSGEPVTMDQMAAMVPGLDAEHFRQLQTKHCQPEETAANAPARELVGAAVASSSGSGVGWRREVSLASESGLSLGLRAWSALGLGWSRIGVEVSTGARAGVGEVMPCHNLGCEHDPDPDLAPTLYAGPVIDAYRIVAPNPLALVRTPTDVSITQAYSEAALRSHRMPEKAPPLGPQPFAGLLVEGGLVLHPQRYLLCASSVSLR